MPAWNWSVDPGRNFGANRWFLKSSPIRLYPGPGYTRSGVDLRKVQFAPKLRWGSGQVEVSDRVSDFGFRVSGFGFRVPGLGFRVPGSEFRLSGFGIRVSGFGIRDSGFGFRIPGFGFRAMGLGVRDYLERCTPSAQRKLLFHHIDVHRLLKGLGFRV